MTSSVGIRIDIRIVIGSTQEGRRRAAPQREERPPETDGGRALRMSVSGDTEVSPGQTLSLTCQAQLTLDPRVRFIMDKFVVFLVFFVVSSETAVEERRSTPW